MKHLKLFEQFDDPFGEETYPITSDDKEIKVGDKVRCVSTSNFQLTLFKTYIVLKTWDNDKMICVLADDGKDKWYMEKRFEKIR